MEFEGEVVRLGNPEVKMRSLLQSIHRLEDEVHALKSELQETKGLLADANEKNARLHGVLTWRSRDKKKPRKTKKAPRMKRNSSVRNEEVVECVT